MGKRGKIVGIALLGSCLMAAAWAHQAGLFESPAQRRIETTRIESPRFKSTWSEVAATASNGLQSFAGPPLTRITQSATTALANSGARRAPGDIDGDGKSDLLLDNIALGQIAYWRMDGQTPVAYSPAFSKPEGYAQVASGDFDGDGKLDIVWARASDRSLLMWVGDGSGFRQMPIRNYTDGWAVTGAGDINGDGKSDLLLGHAAQGLFAYWTMDGATPTGYSPVFASPAEHVQAATGDFNGDGKLDIVWARASDRTLVMWLGDGSGFAQAPIGAYSPGWEISGAGDVDGDGRSDLLLFNKTRYCPFGCSGPGQQVLAYWIMSGATPVRYSPPFFMPSNLVPAAVGDYNGDGKLDVVMVDEQRNLYVPLNDGDKLLPDYAYGPVRTLATGWQLVRGFGAAGYRLRPSYVRGDVDGDGRSDLLLLGVNNGPAGPSAPGKLLSYLMDGPVIRAITPPINLGCATAKPLATGDFNGDGVLDLVFERDCGSRQTIMRFSAGGAFVDATIPNPAPGWSIIGAKGFNLLLGQNVTPSNEMDAVALWRMDGSTVRSYSAGFRTNPTHKRLVAKDAFDVSEGGGAQQSLVWAGTDSAGGQTLLMWRAIPTGFLEEPLQSPAPGWAVFGAGDIDGDGYADLLLSKTSGTPGLAYWIMRGTTVARYSPGFLPPVNAYGAESIVTGDFNGDGNLDLVFPTLESCNLRSCPDGLVMWIGDGNGFRSYDVGSVSPGYRLLVP